MPRAAIVTGAGSGIGAATALRLVRAGWNVAAGYFDTAEHEMIAEVAEAAEKAGAGLFYQHLDVTRQESCTAMVEAAVARFGGLAGLVNAAGISKIVPLADLDDLSPDDFQAIYAVNTVGPFLMARAAAPHLKASGNGAIVNIASYAAFTGGGSSIAYAASKGALNTLTYSLARVLGPEVRVNAICPALVEDGFLQRLAPQRFEDRRKVQIEKTPLARIGKPDDVAETIEWLLGGAPLVTGEILRLDCGLHLEAD
ncbi:SDR family NAD(P)-dependent oxidoreductase [Afifella sp. IM 167]|uniref:SDR family NAD(P)-dependent oxidoreductase n=1 Tax=Afifella sp. IM 167 TaxID=2033586 RepID=UPI001CCF870D|nr:SDR family oxidoreductase [Afifella sp. IM 167]MBZ8132127.1 short-chain dehydrogenase [Afifella sp. IM 167]